MNAAHHRSNTLLRILGLVFGLAVVAGGTIGSGIMRAPGVVALGITSPPLILAAWAVGGAIAMLSAMPLVETGSSIPHAGGPFSIARRAFGPSMGFLTGWLGWLQYSASNAFIAVVFGEYVHRLGFATPLPVSVLAVGLILVVGVLNLAGTAIAGASQSLASGLKGAAFLALTAILFLSPRAAHAPQSLAPAAAITSAGALVMAIRVIYQTYAGWDAAIYFSEEVHRPERNVARATFWGIGLVALLYILVNAAVLHVLSPAAIAGSALAVGDAARVSLGPLGDTAITALGLLSLAAIVNLQIMAASRITFRMAKEGALPAALARVAPGGAPRRSVSILVLISALFAATGSYESIVRIYAPWSIAPILIVCLASIRLRRTEPDLARPWKMPLFPWIAFFAAAIQAGLIAVVVWDDPAAGLGALVFAVLPLPIYWAFSKAWRRQAGLEEAAAVL
jgi:APA family basic amino acid/polyamine antiporter